MKPARLFRLPALRWWLLLGLGGAFLQAHEDPRGDVHPQVVAAGDHFEVYFENNRHAALGSGPAPVYRTTFSAAGAPLAPRARFTSQAPAGAFTLMMIEEQGRPSFMWTPTGQTQPSTVTPQLPAGPWEDCCWLGWAAGERLVMRASQPQPVPGELWPFSLQLVELSSSRVAASAVIGTPGRIYDFACTSPVVEAGEELLIAWMEERHLADDLLPLKDGRSETAQCMAYRLVLTRWNPRTGRVQHTSVAAALSSNVDISLAQLGPVVLVAWHELGAIRTRAVDLRTAPFVPRLPLLGEELLQTGGWGEPDVWAEISAAIFPE